MSTNIIHGETCQLVHHYDDHSYGHEQGQMAPYDYKGQWRCGRCHAVLLSHVGATPEPPPSEATPLPTEEWAMRRIEVLPPGSLDRRAVIQIVREAIGVSVTPINAELSASRREVAALKVQLLRWQINAQKLEDELMCRRNELSAKTAEASDLAFKNARGVQEHIKTIEACNQFREQRNELAAKCGGKSAGEIQTAFCNLAELIEATGFDTFEQALSFVTEQRAISDMADKACVPETRTPEVEAGWQRLQARIMGPEHEANLLNLRNERDAATARAFAAESAHAKQRANYVALFDAILGFGCSTSELKDPIKIVDELQSRAIAAEAQAAQMRETLQRVDPYIDKHWPDADAETLLTEIREATDYTAGQALLDRLKRAEADTKRLDTLQSWLLANGRLDIRENTHDGRRFNYHEMALFVLKHKERGGSDETLREAIDDAATQRKENA